MIAEGHFCAVLDVTTTELADEVADGIYSVGPRRLGRRRPTAFPTL